MSKKTSKKKTLSNKDAAKKDFEEGMFFFNRRDMDNALQYFLKAVEKDPNYIEAWKRLVWQYQFRQDFKKVLDIIEKITELDPHDQDTAGNFIVHILKVYGKEEERTNGITRLNKWIDNTYRKMDKDAKTIHLIGSAFEILGDSESAVRFYEETLKLDPDDKDTQEQLKKIKLKMKK